MGSTIRRQKTIEIHKERKGEVEKKEFRDGDDREREGERDKG